MSITAIVVARSTTAHRGRCGATVVTKASSVAVKVRFQPVLHLTILLQDERVGRTASNVAAPWPSIAVPRPDPLCHTSTTGVGQTQVVTALSVAQRLGKGTAPVRMADKRTAGHVTTGARTQLYGKVESAEIL